jgi:hypothetical protein
MPTSTIKIKSGECVILPSNAIIISAATFDENPAVTSADCPDLALAIEDKIEVAVTGYLKTMKAAGRNRNPAYNTVRLNAIRINDKIYSFTEFDIENLGAYQDRINAVGLGNLVKVVATERREKPNDAGQAIITLRSFPSIINDFTWLGYGSGGGNVETTDIEFRVDTTR